MSLCLDYAGDFSSVAGDNAAQRARQQNRGGSLAGRALVFFAPGPMRMMPACFGLPPHPCLSSVLVRTASEFGIREMERRKTIPLAVREERTLAEGAKREKREF